MRFQQTIGSPVSCSGVGLPFWPAGHTDSSPGSSKYRHRLHLSAWIGRNLIPASISNKVPTGTLHGHQRQWPSGQNDRTPPRRPGGWKSTTYAAEVNAGEVPVLDGSSSPFVRLIRAAGVIPRPGGNRMSRLCNPSKWWTDRNGEDRTVVNAENYVFHPLRSPLIQTQSHTLHLLRPAFEQDIAQARTFGFPRGRNCWSRGL